MKFKRIISFTLAAALVMGGSLASWATETEDTGILTDLELETALIAEEAEAVAEESEEAEEALSQSDAEGNSEAEEGSGLIIGEAEIEDVTEILEEDEMSEHFEEEEEDEKSEDDEDADDEDHVGGYGSQLSTDTSGDTELTAADLVPQGHIVETDNGIQMLDSYTEFSYSYTYNTFTATVDGHSGDEILDMTVDVVVANESGASLGGYDTVLANDNNSGALSIGRIGWHGDLALELVRLIVSEDNATAWKYLGETLYDSNGKAYNLYDEVIKSSTSWSSRVLTNDEVTVLQDFLNENNNPASKTIQDKLARSYVADYVNKGYDLGIRNAAALVYYADIHNQYGNSGGSMGGAKACANYAYNIVGGDWSKVTLNELHLAAVANVAHNYASRSTIKAYLERRRTTYGKLVSCGWTYCNSGDYTIPYDSNGYVGAAWLQTALNYYTNAGLSVNGNYDDALKAAVKSYQQSVGLTADGLAGLHTSTKLIHDMYYTSMQTCGASFSVVTSSTDIVKINGTWTYTVNGTPDYTYTGLAKNSNGWYYVANGVVDFTYNGFAENSNGKWYCEGSKVTFNANSVYKDTTGAIGTKGTWWYVVGSKVQTDFTGLADYRNSNGWWYIKNGQVDFSASGVYKNKNGWYYVEDGKVDMSYNGFASNSNGKWYIENGKVTFNENNVIKDTTGAIGTKGTWWYVVGSKVQTDFTGLADYRNSNGWWYIKNGQVDFTHNGVDKNKNGWYYILDGKVQMDFTGLADYRNSNGWWYIKNGKVDFTHNGVDKNKNGWYYILDGKVQMDFTGLADYRNSNGWWYIKNGKVDFTFYGIAKNKNGWWYVKDGKVDFSFTGTVTANGTKYSVTNGKVAM